MIISEIICLGIGFWAGAIVTALYLSNIIGRKNKQIKMLQAQVSIKAIITPIVTYLARDLFKSVFKFGGDNEQEIRKKTPNKNK